MSRVSTASAAGMAASVVVVVVGADVVVDVAGGCVALVRWPRLDAGLEGNATRTPTTRAMTKRAPSTAGHQRRCRRGPAELSETATRVGAGAVSGPSSAVVEAPGTRAVRFRTPVDGGGAASGLGDGDDAARNGEVTKSAATSAPSRRCPGRWSSMPLKRSFQGTGRSPGRGTGPAIRLATTWAVEPS